MKVRVAARKLSDYLTAISRMTEPDSDVRDDVDGLLLVMHELREASDEEKLSFLERLEVPYR